MQINIKSAILVPCPPIDPQQLFKRFNKSKNSTIHPPGLDLLSLKRYVIPITCLLLIMLKMGIILLILRKNRIPFNLIILHADVHDMHVRQLVVSLAISMFV
jgi:hypothetical protein